MSEKRRVRLEQQSTERCSRHLLLGLHRRPRARRVAGPTVRRQEGVRRLPAGRVPQHRADTDRVEDSLLPAARSALSRRSGIRKRPRQRQTSRARVGSTHGLGQNLPYIYGGSAGWVSGNKSWFFKKKRNCNVLRGGFGVGSSVTLLPAWVWGWVLKIDP